MQDADKTRNRKTPRESRIGVDVIAALQASPHRDIDIEQPYFSGEDELSALLLAMVIDHCAGYSREDQRAGLTRAPHDRRRSRQLRRPIKC